MKPRFCDAPERFCPRGRPLSRGLLAELALDLAQIAAPIFRQ
jgi:hypothetical protein